MQPIPIDLKKINKLIARIRAKNKIYKDELLPYAKKIGLDLESKPKVAPPNTPIVEKIIGLTKILEKRSMFEKKKHQLLKKVYKKYPLEA